MSKIKRIETKRLNVFDGQQINESDLDAEQANTLALAANNIIDFHGSGIVKTNPFDSKILLDTREPGKYGSNASELEYEAGTYDGKGMGIDIQPSDTIYGNRLELELVDVSGFGRHKPKIMIIGKTFDGENNDGSYTIEFLEFHKNEKLVTKYFYKNIISILFNNFSGGEGKTELKTYAESFNLIQDSGYLIIRETEPLSVYAQPIANYAVESPNFDLMTFITHDVSTSIEQEIEDALGASNSISDLYIDLDGESSSVFHKDDSTTIAFGQKFLAKTDNIQRIDLLLSAERDTDLPTDEQLDFSGDLVLAVHELMTESTNTSSSIPENLIDFDPDMNPLMEVSYSQDDFEALGIKLGEDPQVVSFSFASTLLADPNQEPKIIPGKYYAFILTRRGDTSVGEINVIKGKDKVVGKTEASVDLTIIEQFEIQDTRFFELDPDKKRYIDNSEQSLWFKIYSDCLEITDGTAYTEAGVAVTVPKYIDYVGSTVISNFQRNLSLRSISSSESNYLVLSQKQEFTDPRNHPRTKNYVATRIKDVPSFSVLNSTELDNITEYTPLILSKIVDKNTRAASDIDGTFIYPGQITQNQITIINPSNTLLTSNLINRVIIPDTNCDCNAKYRIVATSCQKFKSGDLNKDSELTTLDLGEMASLLGNAFNSEATQSKIFNNVINYQDLYSADLNNDGLVDGDDLEILEDAIDGYVNFAIEEEFTVLTLTLENVLEDSDYPEILSITDTGQSTDSGTNIVYLTIEDQERGLINIGDFLIIEDGVDAGTYIVSSKDIESETGNISLTVTNEDGGVVTFSGSTDPNITITSGTATNILADNPDLIKIPFETLSYKISFIESNFEGTFLELCNLSRDVAVSFIEEQDNSCVVVDSVCGITSDCEPVYKNQTYLPGDLYLPNGNILTAPGTPHPGDFEYTTISIPIPAGTIDNCSVDLYNTFIKSYNNTAYTAAGYPAMKYSDGTLVGCEDSGTNTDIYKGRIKFEQSISSIYVDALTDGYDGYTIDSTELEESAEEYISENFKKVYYRGFNDWTENGLNDGAITNITHAVLADAIFELVTSSSSTEKFGRLDGPSAAQNLTGDFIIDAVAKRTVWEESSLLSGKVYSSLLAVITNTDSTSTLKVGWVTYGGSTKIFYKGTIVNGSSEVIDSFNYEVDAPDDVNTEVTFRLRRINDIVTAYYIIPDQLTEVEGQDFGSFIKIGENPDTQPGDGSVDLSYEISQESSPTAGVSFYSRLINLDIRSEHSTVVSSDTITIGRVDSTDVVDSLTFTIPFNLPRRTTIVSAYLNMITKTADTITDTYGIKPLNLLNADNLGTIFNVPLDPDNANYEYFVPNTITIDGDLSIDITTAFIALLSKAGNLPGFYKGFVIEPSNIADSSFDISKDITFTVTYSELTTGVVFKIGAVVNPLTGILTLNTKNILFDNLNTSNRTVLNFGVYLKKSGFKNANVEVSLNDLKRVGIGTCFNEQDLTEDEYCYFIVGDTTVGTYVGGPYECAQ